MIPRSETLADLIEPTLYALRNPSSDLLEPLVKSARNARLHAQAALRTTRRDVDLYSFELGVASAMTELLTVADQRSVISDAAKVVKSMPRLKRIGAAQAHLESQGALRENKSRKPSLG